MKSFIHALGCAVLLVITSACGSRTEFSEISDLNGYWEIEQVIADDGREKNYTGSMSYDFMQFTDSTGFRKKVVPQFDGSFLVNDRADSVRLKQIDGKLFLVFKNEFSEWKEELQTLSDQKMVLLNAEDKEYHYKKTGPMQFTDGEKAE